MLPNDLFDSANDLSYLLSLPPQALPLLGRKLHEEVANLARVELPDRKEILGLEDSYPAFKFAVAACVKRNLITRGFGYALCRAFDICISLWEIDPNPQPVSATRREDLNNLVISVASDEVFAQYEFEKVGPWLHVNDLKTCVCVMVILIRSRAKRPAEGFRPPPSPWG